jgi:hypothetical protein
MHLLLEMHSLGLYKITSSCAYTYSSPRVSKLYNIAIRQRFNHRTNWTNGVAEVEKVISAFAGSNKGSFDTYAHFRLKSLSKKGQSIIS